MSAFTADGDFVPRLPAHPLRVDATADPSFGRLIAMNGHSAQRAWGHRSQFDFEIRSKREVSCHAKAVGIFLRGGENPIADRRSEKGRPALPPPVAQD